MSQMKIVANGFAGATAAAASLTLQEWAKDLDPMIKLLTGIGGLVVIGLTIFVSLLTARLKSREIEKANAEIAALKRQGRSLEPSETRWSDGSP